MSIKRDVELRTGDSLGGSGDSPKQAQAVELKSRTGDSHYNCCQAVACVFADEVGMSSDTLRKLGAGFGLGMGTMGGTCGALCGAQMILGLARYHGKPIRDEAAGLYNEFKELCGATVCRDIKGVDTKVMLCSCDDCVRNAVGLLEKRFESWSR